MQTRSCAVPGRAHVPFQAKRWRVSVHAGRMGDHHDQAVSGVSEGVRFAGEYGQERPVTGRPPFPLDGPVLADQPGIETALEITAGLRRGRDAPVCRPGGLPFLRERRRHGRTRETWYRLRAKLSRQRLYESSDVRGTSHQGPAIRGIRHSRHRLFLKTLICPVCIR